MNPPPPPPPPPTTPKKEVQLQGPRPAPLKLSKDSVKIKKPPPHPHLFRHHHNNQPQPPQPVVIYTVSPKVIHTSVNEFMPLVQRLTGHSSSPPGDLSPAARIASIEKTSPSASAAHFPAAATTTTIDDDLMDSILEGIDIMGQFPGILSPAPATMPPISPGFFSPAVTAAADSLNFNWQGVAASSSNFNSSFTASPSSNSALFSTPLVSPSPSSWDFFNNFLDF